MTVSEFIGNNSANANFPFTPFSTATTNQILWHAKLLAEAVPPLSGPAGAIPVTTVADSRRFDMMDPPFRDTMKRRIMMVLGALLLTVAPLTADEIGLKNAMVTFRVIDDIGNPVDGVHVNAGDLWSAKGYQGLSDTNGSFTCYWRKIYSPIGGIFGKKGYYITQGDVWSWTQWGEVPTNKLTVTLKRIINPVPMVKREVLVSFPRLGLPIGFDIEAGDWVAPDGRGRVADFWATGSSRYVSRTDHDISARIVFSNALDGVQEFTACSPYKGVGPAACALPPPTVAPTNGYANTLLLWQSWKPGSHITGHYRENQNHIFRVRVDADPEGNIVKAHYAWTLGGLMLDIDKKYGLYLMFKSYYNPDPLSRSLEPLEIADRQ